jgi:Flp pilus assembly protein TadD
VCWAHATSGDSNAGLAYCNKALELRPNQASILDSRGLLFLRLNQNAEAKADFDAALTTQPKLAGSLFARGVAKRRLGDTASGDADIAASKSLNPKIAETYAKYGVTP